MPESYFKYLPYGYSNKQLWKQMLERVPQQV